MFRTISKNVKVAGVATTVPKNSLTIRNNSSIYNGDKKKLEKAIALTGFESRRIASHSMCSSDLCFDSAQKLIEDLKINRDDISTIIFLSQTPDYLMPATACTLHKRLNLSENCAAFDVNQGCAGYVYGLWLASKVLNNKTDKVLLLVGDTSSKYTDMFGAQEIPIFGDAGSATLLEFSENEKIFFNFFTDGSSFDAIIANNGGFRNPPKNNMFDQSGNFQYDAHMSGSRVMEFTLNKVPMVIEDLLEFSKKSIKDTDIFFFHQANRFIVENIANSLNIPLDKVPRTALSVYGNQSCTSIPGSICYESMVKNNFKRSSVVLSGFGIGLSVANCQLDLSETFVSKIYEI